jgi:hypothetical protein
MPQQQQPDQPGFYWIRSYAPVGSTDRRIGAWEIALFEGLRWWPFNGIDAIQPEHIAQIGPRIEPPLPLLIELLGTEAGGQFGVVASKEVSGGEASYTFGPFQKEAAITHVRITAEGLAPVVRQVNNTTLLPGVTCTVNTGRPVPADASFEVTDLADAWFARERERIED